MKVFIENIDNLLISENNDYNNETNSLLKLKEKYNHNKSLYKKMVINCKFLFKLINITSVNKSFSSCFKRWNQSVLSDNYKEIVSSVNKAQNELDVLSIRLVANIFRTKLLDIFKHFCNNCNKNFILSLEDKFHVNKGFPTCLERIYNKRLLKFLNGVEKIGRLIINSKSRIFKVNKFSFKGNQIYPYFEIWRTFSSKICQINKINIDDSAKKRTVYLVSLFIKIE